MSGASAGYWSVAENLALQRRILEERQARVQGLADQSMDLCARARNARERHGEGFPYLVGRDPVWNATPETVGEADALIQQIQVFNERLAKNLAQALAIVEFKQMIRVIGGERNERQEQRQSVTTSPAPGKAEREALIESLLKGAGDSIAEPAVLECARMAIEAEQKARFDTLKTELRYRIQKRNDAARARNEQISLAARLRDRLAGLEGEGIANLAEELGRVEKGEIALRPSLASEVEAAVEAARSRADREYAATVLREELTRLGYLVEEGFESLFLSGGKLRLHKPDLREYHVVMSVNPSKGSLAAYVARTGEPNEKLSEERRQRDREMERTWCNDLGALLSESRRKGIETNITEQLAPGQQAVVVKAAPAQAPHAKLRHFQRGSE